MVTLRPFRPADTADVYDVCVRTADAGADATGQLSRDDLWGDIFAGPYLALEPELAFVLDDGVRVVGYVLGTADTQRWAAAHREHWLPRVAGTYPRVAEPSTREEHLVDLLHDPEHYVHPELADHPAHLHIDVLPAYQGQGHGRRLIETFLAALAERGVPGVHLSVLVANTRARGFYARMGFTELPVHEPDVVFLGRAVASARR